jgi:hypothetical protein
MQPDPEGKFSRLKRKKWCGWSFLMSGEWSQTPIHQGNTNFFIAHTADERNWALLHKSFPPKIVAVAEVNSAVSKEEVAALMMRRLADQDGPYIESPHDYGEIDSERFWQIYDSAGDVK